MRRLLPDLSLAALLFLLPLIAFWPQTVGGRTLLPAENLYQYEPYATYREAAGAPAVPHNHLISDLVLQNMQWKLFIRASIAQGEVPLWNPYQFSGIPFLAAGQQSTLYPLSLIYYVLPLPAAYGWFTVAQLWLAGAFMYVFARGVGVGRFGGAVAGVTYQLSGFFVISAVFPMIIGAAAWLPLILLMIEWVVRRRPISGRPASALWMAVGAGALGCSVLAGHVEITYYTLLLAAFYAALRLIPVWHSSGWRAALGRAGWLLALALVGVSLGAIQFVPLFEWASQNWRAERSSIDTVLSYAHPLRDVVQFILPNFYGNPAHHAYFDWFSGQTVPVTVNALGEAVAHTEWGIKNYVEGALYVGILPLALALYAVGWGRPVHRALHLVFGLIGLLGLTFMFGLPTYRLLYLLPGINQLNSPFRWVFAVTLAAAALAGFGADALLRDSSRRPRRVGAALLLAGGAVIAAGLAGLALWPRIAPLVDRLFRALAGAECAFADAQMFYSYQLTNALWFGVFALGAGAAFWLASPSPVARPARFSRALSRGDWGAAFAIVVVAADLLIASHGFYPASDPALLAYEPPAVQWLKGRPGAWRYTTLDDPTQRPIMNANMGWMHGLRDIRGYESIISGQYVDYMRGLAPQTQLDYNRIAPLYTVYPAGVAFDYADALRSERLAHLGVRYVISHRTTTLPEGLPWTLAYEDEAVRIWENAAGAVGAALYASLDDSVPVGAAQIASDSGRERFIEARADAPAWLVVNETYAPGWRAYARPSGAGDDDETALDVVVARGNFQGVYLPQAGAWTVRLVYSPASFQLGLFASAIGAALAAFALGVWLWRTFVVARSGDTLTARVARNSAAPIILNLFNRGIDFALAIVMLRILGPEDAGIYFYAAFIFGWFDIFTNFGLDVYVTREVARDTSRAARLFFTSSGLRLLLTLAGLILLAGFLAVRQGAVDTPLAPHAVGAIALLYLGLFPASLSKGMTSIFYAFQQAEYPAAVTTLSTISKAVLGVAALLLGYGVIGLAAASIVTNVVTLGVLVYGGRRLLGGFVRPDARLLRGMVGQSWPLMLNHFLATIFFQIDVVIMEWIHGPRMVGLYSVAYKWVAALNVIPAFFTMALLPVMSKQAKDDRAALKRTYVLAVKLLVGAAVPLAVLFTFLAHLLTFILGGAQYLPDGAIATQLMIWSIPFGWINSLTQYVLIALDLQRRITLAFILAVTFNIVTNLIFIPRYGYQAAAVTTIFSEIVLLIPFGVLLHRTVGRLPWGEMVWRPAAAGAAMFAAMALLWRLQPAIALAAGLVVYPGLLLALRPFRPDEIERLLPLLPGRLRRAVAR
ncbi:MAG: oligosaccharide flippase family protein [Aggregatilineales bacterium]